MDTPFSLKWFLQPHKLSTTRNSSTTTSSSWLLRSRVRTFDELLNNLDLRSPISNKELIQFLEANHNLMIFADSDSRKPIRSLANELGMDFENAVST